MATLIEVDDLQSLPRSLTIHVGDAVRLPASGARMVDGSTVLQALGPFVVSVVGTTGIVMAPLGGPNAILLVALREGRATAEIFYGDPWQDVSSMSLEILVE